MSKLNTNMDPVELLKIWLTDEHHSGTPKPCQAILATCTKDAIPHARVVAIHEIDEHSLLFFTQRGTRKVKELFENPFATMTFWFEILQREVTVLIARDERDYCVTAPDPHSPVRSSKRPHPSKRTLTQ